MSLLASIRSHLPISGDEWRAVQQEHLTAYPDADRTVDSLRRKFSSLHRSRVPTGDPNCPAEVREAKRIKCLIIERAQIADENDDNDVHLQDVMQTEQEDPPQPAEALREPAEGIEEVTPPRRPRPLVRVGGRRRRTSPENLTTLFLMGLEEERRMARERLDQERQMMEERMQTERLRAERQEQFMQLIMASVFGINRRLDGVAAPQTNVRQDEQGTSNGQASSQTEQS